MVKKIDEQIREEKTKMEEAKIAEMYRQRVDQVDLVQQLKKEAGREFQKKGKRK